MLIFTHAVPKERKVTVGSKLLQQFPWGSPEREIGLELLKSDVLQLKEGATQLLKLVRLRLGKDLQQPFPSPFRAALHCRGIKPARASHAGSRICVHTGKRRTRDQGHYCRCFCVDFFCWKTRHSQDHNKFLSSVSRVRARRTIILLKR